MASGAGLVVIGRVVFAAAMLVAAALCMAGCAEDAGPDADPSPWSASADISTMARSATGVRA
jgi:3-oxoacyl-(acyl-carrier-protein) synthase